MARVQRNILAIALCIAVNAKNLRFSHFDVFDLFPSRYALQYID